MVTYLARFIPDLSQTLTPIRALSKKGTEWQWTEECQAAFERTKQKLTKAPALVYFDPTRPLSIQEDSSKYGIGAALLQDGKPVEYASRSLAPNERNWAQREKEALAIVFGIERFDQNTYDRPVEVQNDHKP
jgi:hypothetical protein